MKASESQAEAIAAAWSAYLDSISHPQPLDYEEVEPWAWAQLQAELERIASGDPFRLAV